VKGGHIRSLRIAVMLFVNVKSTSGWGSRVFDADRCPVCGANSYGYNDVWELAILKIEPVLLLG